MLPCPIFSSIAAASHGVADELFDRGRTARIGHRAHVAGVEQAIAHVDFTHAFGEGCNKFVVNALLDIEACWGHAYLPGVAEFSCGEHLDGSGKISIVKYDRRGVTTELHRSPLYRGRREGEKMFANCGRSGER